MLKNCYCYVLFCLFEKPFKYEKYFQFHLYIFLKENFLVSKYKKQIFYEESKSLCFCCYEK